MPRAFFWLPAVLLPFFALQLPAQLVLSGPIPKTANPPVVFINGYQTSCGGPFSDTFFSADKLLQSQGIVSLFFDNCSVPGKPSLETEGAALGQFIAALKYADGTPVPQVDVIAHSMGGLILRAYLAGMQDGSPATFRPPAVVPVRRAIFIATPHFGSAVASLGSSLGGGGDKQTFELTPGSQFLFDLNSWNQGTDDLRGVSSISISGNGGTGFESGISGFDDGVASLTSTSLNFYRGSVTRVLPYCHTSSSLLTLVNFCSSSTPALTNINTDPNNPVGQIIVSFLTGTDAWKTVGQAVEAVSAATSRSGIDLELRDNNDQVQNIGSAAIVAMPRNIDLSENSNRIAYTETAPAGPATVQATPATGGATQSGPVTLPAATETIAILKPGPAIFPKGIIPAVTQTPFPFDVAPGQYVAIYGTSLASASLAQPQPYPTQVNDLQVLVNGAAIPIQYSGPGQINAVFPSVAPGLAQLTVKNSAGQQTVNVRVAAAVPAIFELGGGTAAAIDVTTGQTVFGSAAAHPGDFVSIYLTGLGATDNRGGLDYAHIQPTVSVGGADCPVSYAGRTPGVAGLDQINCKLPTGTTGAAVPVVVTSNGRQAPTVTLNIQ